MSVEVRDPGLQPERTALAWSRTALALVVVSVLTLRWLPSHGPIMLVLPALAVVGWAAITIAARRRALRTCATMTSNGVAPGTSLALLMTTTCVLLGGAAAVVAIVA